MRQLAHADPDAVAGNPLARRVLKGVSRAVFGVLTSTEVCGLEHAPPRGPLIVAMNHVAEIDPAVSTAFLPWPIESLALVDLLSVPGTATLLRLYGVIPVDRDAHNGSAIVLALDALRQDKIVGILPEGRVSLTGGLERARTGVAYLALTSGAPVLPCAITGTEVALARLKRLRRPRLTLTVGQPLQFELENVTGPNRHARLRDVADQIMYRIAALLPARYRGVYGMVPPVGPPPRHSVDSLAGVDVSRGAAEA